MPSSREKLFSWQQAGLHNKYCDSQYDGRRRGDVNDELPAATVLVTGVIASTGAGTLLSMLGISRCRS